VKILTNPYPHVIPDTEFPLLINTLVERLCLQIDVDHTELDESQFHYLKRPSLGLCLMNPTLPRYTPAQEAVLALIAIGPEGEDYLVNGVGKAVTHWEMGQDCGIGAYVEPHRLPDGAFIYGHSAEVNGTIVGASGATEQQDRAFATRFAAEFNSCVGDAHKRWQESNPSKSWYSKQGAPRELFTEIASLLNT
jgi:hypothetical protein